MPIPSDDDNSRQGNCPLCGGRGVVGAVERIGGVTEYKKCTLEKSCYDHLCS
jgi:hypothetical protein